MDCSFIKKNLFAILENTLSPVDQVETDLHIKSCPECSLVITEFQETMGIINHDKSKDINPFMSTRIIQRIESVRATQGTRQQKVFLHILQPAVFTFSLFLAILIGFSVGKTGMNRMSDKTSADLDLTSIRSELFISDITDEDKTLFLNP
jgi:predicted anti-sigma-YlaC factor YlaD